MARVILAQPPYRKIRDLRSAMVRTLADFIRARTFTAPQTTEPFQLAAVYEEWAAFEARALRGTGLPAAAVLPDRALPDDDAFTPRFLEETWTGGDPTLVDEVGDPLFPVGTGEDDGFGLYAVAEKVVPFVLLIRAASKPQRQAIVSDLEDAFVDIDYPGTVGVVRSHWGKVLRMPEYFGLPLRVTYKAHQLLDTAETAKANRWMVQFELLAEAKQVVVGRVPAMDVRVSVVVDGVQETR